MTEDALDVIRLAISGMTCDACAVSVTRVLKRVPGVVDVAVELAAERAKIAGAATPAALIAAVEKAGYGAVESDSG